MPVRAQTFDSNGPEVRIRGNAYQVLEKYLALARDAQAAGDRIAAENFYQHAEHYYRLINANGGHDRPPMSQGGEDQGHGSPGDPGAGPQPYAANPADGDLVAPPGPNGSDGRTY